MRLLRPAIKVTVIVVILMGVSIAGFGRERVLSFLFGPIDQTPIPFATLKKTPNPNQHLVCPENLCTETPDAISPVFPIPADQLKQKWSEVMANQPNIDPEVIDEGNETFTYIQRTLLIRYPDSITVQFLPLNTTTSTLAIYSRSHYGKSDFGVNEKRIGKWLNALDQLL